MYVNRSKSSTLSDFGCQTREEAFYWLLALSGVVAHRLSWTGGWRLQLLLAGGPEGLPQFVSSEVSEDCFEAAKCEIMESVLAHGLGAFHVTRDGGAPFIEATKLAAE